LRPGVACAPPRPLNGITLSRTAGDMMQVLIIIAWVLSAILGFVVTSEGIYNVRRVAAIGNVFPRSGCMMMVCWALMLLVGAFLFNSSGSDFMTGCIIWSVAAIPGVIAGLSADPRQ
jgi:hypothetical protein